jgi:hypothetical protein
MEFKQRWIQVLLQQHSHPQAGGSIRPDPNDKSVIADLGVNGADAEDPGVFTTGHAF